MTFSQNTFWRWLFYGIYALLLVAILLYFRFPTQKFKNFCVQIINQHLSGYDSSIGSLRYQFPLTMVVNNLHLQSNSQTAKNRSSAEPIPEGNNIGSDKPADAKIQVMTGEVIDLQKVAITPSLRGRGKTFFLSITAYGGTHRAKLVFDRAHNTFSLSKIEINGLDLAKLSWIQTQTGRAITGLVTFQGSCSWQSGTSISLGTGEGTAHIKNGTFELLYPIFSLKNIDIESGEVLLKLQEQKMLLTKGKFIGKELEGTFSGQIDLQGINFALMQLDVTGALTPLPALIKKSGQDKSLLQQLQKNHATSPFKLQGTIGKPAFRFDS